MRKYDAADGRGAGEHAAGVGPVRSGARVGRRSSREAEHALDEDTDGLLKNDLRPERRERPKR